MDILGDSTWHYLGAVGALAMLVLTVRYTSAHKRRQDAVAAYRAAFEGALFNLRENPDCPIAEIAANFHLQCVAATVKFRDQVRFWQRGGFEAAVAEYKQAQAEATGYGGAFSLVEVQASASAQQARARYDRAIHRLLAFA